jgi:hypothetical protein
MQKSVTFNNGLIWVYEHKQSSFEPKTDGDNLTFDL